MYARYLRNGNCKRAGGNNRQEGNEEHDENHPSMEHTRMLWTIKAIDQFDIRPAAEHGPRPVPDLMVYDT